MTTVIKSSSRPPSCSPSQGGTLDRTHSLPTHSDLQLLMASDVGPIRSVQDACKWLEMKGWILMANLYDWAKIVSILVTATLTSRPQELKNAAIVVTFLIDADISDHLSDSLAEVVTSKALGCIRGLVDKLSSSTNFLAVNNTEHAESMLKLKFAADTLEGITNLLCRLVSKLMSAPPLASPPLAPTWALITKVLACLQVTPATMGPIGENSFSSDDLTQIQQHILCNAHTILIQFNPQGGDAPANH